MKARIEVLVGMIGSGKSSYARWRADQGALVICHDDLTQMLHGRYRYEPELRACYRAMQIQLAQNGIVAGRDVIIDRNHLTRESRAFWIDVARRSENTPIVAVPFPIGSAEDHARRRFYADARGRSYEEWLKVALHHEAQAAAEPLLATEGFDAILPVVQ